MNTKLSPLAPKLYRPRTIEIVGQQFSGESTQKYYLIRVNRFPLTLPWTDFLIFAILGMRLQAEINNGWTSWEMLTEDQHCAQQYVYRLRQNIRSRLCLAGQSDKPLVNWPVFQNRINTGLYRLLANNSRTGLIIHHKQIQRVSDGDYRIAQCLKSLRGSR